MFIPMGVVETFCVCFMKSDVCRENTLTNLSGRQHCSSYSRPVSHPVCRVEVLRTS